MDCVIDVCHADVQAFLAYSKFALALLYRGFCGAALRQKVSSCWDYINLTVVGGSYLVLLSDGLVFGTLRARSPSCATVRTDMGGLSRLSIAYDGKLFFSWIPSLLDVFSHDSALDACCLMPARCTTPKSNLESLGCHHESPLVESVRLRIHLRAS